MELFISVVATLVENWTTLKIIETMARVVTAVAKVLGLISPEESVESFGDKVLQAEDAGYKLEDYDSYNDYVKAIEDFQIDPEKSGHYSPEQKEECAAKVLSGLIIENHPEVKEGFKELADLAASKSEYFQPERIEQLGKLMAEEKDFDLFKKVADVLNGVEKNYGIVDQAFNWMKTVEKRMDPALTEAAACEKIMSMIK